MNKYIEKCGLTVGAYSVTLLVQYVYTVEYLLALFLPTQEIKIALCSWFSIPAAVVRARLLRGMRFVGLLGSCLYKRGFGIIEREETFAI